MHATLCGRFEENSLGEHFALPKRPAIKITVLRFAIPDERCAVTGAVSVLQKTDGHFRIARYPKIGLKTILSKNYCDSVIVNRA